VSGLPYRVAIVVYDSSLSEFKQRLCEKLEGVGDAAVSAQRHGAAVSGYSAALSLDPASRQGLLIKRSKAHVLGGSWEDALDDANTVGSFVSRRVVLVDSVIAR